MDNIESSKCVVIAAKLEKRVFQLSLETRMLTSIALHHGGAEKLTSPMESLPVSLVSYASPS